MRNILEQNTVYNGLRDLLQNPEDIFADTLQTISDYRYYLEQEQYQELMEIVHEKLPTIFRNILECQSREDILRAVWMLETYFGVSYEESLVAVETDVKHSKMFSCVDYPAQWLASYCLVKAGYDFFYGRKEIMAALYPKASECIEATFSQMWQD